MFIQLYSLHLNSLRFKIFFFSLEWQGLTLDICSSHNSQRDTWCYMEHQAYQGHDPIRVTSLLQERHCSFSCPGGKKKINIYYLWFYSIICSLSLMFGITKNNSFTWKLMNHWASSPVIVIVNYRHLRQLTGHCKH